MLYGADGKLITGVAVTGKRVEIVRSVSRKVNLGNYESADFFCSMKASCDQAEADSVSADLTDWCYDQILSDLKSLKQKQAKKLAQESAPKGRVA